MSKVTIEKVDLKRPRHVPRARFRDTFLGRQRWFRSTAAINSSRFLDFWVWGEHEGKYGPCPDCWGLSLMGVLNGFFVRLGFLLTVDVDEDGFLNRWFLQRRYWKP